MNFQRNKKFKLNQVFSSLRQKKQRNILYGKSAFPLLPTGTKPRVLLATQPKAGTYLLSQYLVEIGYHQTHFHLDINSMEAYDRNLLELGASDPKLFNIQIPITSSLRLIRSGEFAASHLTPSCELDKLVGDDFRIFVSLRELRSAIVSWAHFLMASRKNGESAMLGAVIRERGLIPFMQLKGKKLIEQADKLVDWQERPQAIIVRFETLKENKNNVAEEIASHLGIHISSPEEKLNVAMTKTTLTSLTKKSELVWTDEVEELFIRLGGDDVNRRMGYLT